MSECPACGHLEETCMGYRPWRAAAEGSEPLDVRQITDEEAGQWLKANDLYAVTHLHEPPSDCAECAAEDAE